jgi:hypothetical protein
MVGEIVIPSGLKAAMTVSLGFKKNARILAPLIERVGNPWHLYSPHSL